MMKNLTLATIFIFIYGTAIGSNPYKGDICMVKSEFIYQPDDVSWQKSAAA